MVPFAELLHPASSWKVEQVSNDGIPFRSWWYWSFSLCVLEVEVNQSSDQSGQRASDQVDSHAIGASTLMLQLISISWPISLTHHDNAASGIKTARRGHWHWGGSEMCCFAIVGLDRRQASPPGRFIRGSVGAARTRNGPRFFTFSAQASRHQIKGDKPSSIAESRQTSGHVTPPMEVMQDVHTRNWTCR